MISPLSPTLAVMAALSEMVYIGTGIAIVLVVGVLALIVNSYRKVEQGKAFIQSSAL